MTADTAFISSSLSEFKSLISFKTGFLISLGTEDSEFETKYSTETLSAFASFTASVALGTVPAFLMLDTVVSETPILFASQRYVVFCSLRNASTFFQKTIL